MSEAQRRWSGIGTERFARLKRWFTSLSMMGAFALAASALPTAALGQANARPPNIVIIWGDDIGQSNVSAYSHGLMGYQTPNIDRVAREGVMFTDY